jgi:hypothetical protein
MFVVHKYLTTLMITIVVFEAMRRPEGDTISKFCLVGTKHVIFCWLIYIHFHFLQYLFTIHEQLAYV